MVWFILHMAFSCKKLDFCFSSQIEVVTLGSNFPSVKWLSPLGLWVQVGRCHLLLELPHSVSKFTGYYNIIFLKLETLSL